MTILSGFLCLSLFPVSANFDVISLVSITINFIFDFVNDLVTYVCVFFNIPLNNC